MKIITINRFPALAGVLCAGLLLLLTGCTKSTIEECPDEVELEVKVVDVEGEDITDKGVIETVSLFVFDHDKLFLKQIDTRVGESLRLYFPDQDIINVVSWGNLSDNSVKITELKPGTPMHEAMVSLLENPLPQSKAAQTTIQSRPAARGIAIPPTDLFYSYDEISLKTGAQISYTLQMNRMVSAMSITMRNLQSYANRYDDNYSLVVRETYNAIDFYGRLTGDKVGYVPKSAFNDKKELIAPMFNLLPSHAEGVIEIDIYHEDQLITTVKNDNNGHPLKALQGKVLNVLVDFHMNVSVTVSLTPWGVTEIPKEF